MDQSLPSEFHTVILGTGLVESLVAAALSRVGKTVLHLDKEQFYGSSDACFQMTDFAEFLSAQAAESETRKPLIDNIVPIGFDTPIPRPLSRKFSIDLSPKLVWSSGKFVDALVRSGVNRYLEFKPLNGCTMYLNGALQPVPCSKGEIFKNKLISLVEKNKLMKFLLSIQSPSQADTDLLNSLLEKPFVEFLKARQLSNNLIQFILYSIALIQTNETENPKITTAEGIQKLGHFLKASGRFGPTPFICPLYGFCEIAQSFCRVAAVYGAVYMLGHNAKEILIEENEVKGIVDLFDQKISTQFLVSNACHSPQFSSTTKERVSRCILGSKQNLLGDGNNNELLIIPPKTFGNSEVITIFQYTDSLNVTPTGTFLHHIFMKSSEEKTAQEDLSAVIGALFEFKKGKEKENKEAGEGEENVVEEEKDQESTKPLIEYCVYFNSSQYNRAENAPKNLFLVDGPNPLLTPDNALIEAEKIFKMICPDESFIPEVPHPEDVIFDFGEEKKEENKGEVEPLDGEMKEKESENKEENKEEEEGENKEEKKEEEKKEEIKEQN